MKGYIILLFCLICYGLAAAPQKVTEPSNLQPPPAFISEEHAKTLQDPSLSWEEEESTREVGSGPSKWTKGKCHAPAFEMGPMCNSSEKLLGDSPHTQIDYHVTIDEDKVTGVFCYGLGYGYCMAPMSCKWGYHFLGLISTGTASIIWGDTEDYPSVKCTAIPKAVKLKWTWEKGFCSSACSSHE